MLNSPINDPKLSPKLMDYIILLIKWRRFIFVVTSFSVIAAIIYTLIVPKVFESKTRILPVDSNSSSGLAGLMQEFPLMGMGLSLGGSASDEVRMILESRDLRIQIIDTFSLLDSFELSTYDEALVVLGDVYHVRQDEDGSIVYTLRWHTSWFNPFDHTEDGRVGAFAEQMAQEVKSILVRRHNEMNQKQASLERVFIERRYLDTAAKLKEAENTLQAFQEEHGLILLDEQAKAAITLVSELTAQQTAKEIEKEISIQTFSKNSPEVNLLKHELSLIQSKINELYGGRDGVQNIFPDLSQVPELEVDYIRLRRDVEIQSRLFLYLTTQLEEAKIFETKNTPSIKVIEEPYVPELKSEPMRSSIVISTTFMSFIMSIILSIVFNYFSKTMQNKEYRDFFSQISWISNKNQS